jgi:pyrroline-5-carboxylate reductase
MASGTLGIVGVGRLASFMIEGIRKSGDRRAILLSPRNADTARRLATEYDCKVVADNQTVIDGADEVIVATPPKDALATIRSLRWRDGQLVVCVAIDVEHAALQEAAIGAMVVRAMPTAASAIGLGSTPIYPDDERARALLGLVGDVFPCADEDQFKVATAASVYHLWMYALMERMAQAAQDAGLPRATAVGLVAGFTQSAGAFAKAADPAQSMRLPLDVNGTPGTMTAQGLAVIEAADALAPWTEALAVAVERARSGSKKV